MKINKKNWAAFTVEELFDEIKATKGKTTGQLVKGDDVPYIAAAKTNNGFARGNNLMMKFAWQYKPDYYLLLNNDTFVSFA